MDKTKDCEKCGSTPNGEVTVAGHCAWCGAKL